MEFRPRSTNRVAYAICLALSKTIIDRFRVAHPSETRVAQGVALLAGFGEEGRDGRTGAG